MDALTNPYTPGAGTKPPALTGRDEQLAHFELLMGRLERGKPERSMLITGLRGVGKTVLLTTFEDMALERGWFPALSEIRHDTELRLLMARMSRRVLPARPPTSLPSTTTMYMTSTRSSPTGRAHARTPRI